MKVLKNVLRGKLAKHNGKVFEHSLRLAALRSGFHPIQIPMGARMVSAQKMIRVQTPFDFIFFHEEGILVVDAKSTKKKSFSYTDTTPHQVMELLKIEKKGYLAGYIIYFEVFNKIIFVKASELARLQSKQSLSVDDGVPLLSLNTIDLSLLLPLIRKSNSDCNTPYSSQ